MATKRLKTDGYLPLIHLNSGNFFKLSNLVKMILNNILQGEKIWGRSDGFTDFM